jgi:hypothetical protein
MDEISDNDETPPPPSTWVTVEQAARQLGISERQVQRYASRVGESNRREVEGPTGSTLALVCLEAISSLREKVAKYTSEPKPIDGQEDSQPSEVHTPAPVAPAAQVAPVSPPVSDNAQPLVDASVSVSPVSSVSENSNQNNDALTALLAEKDARIADLTERLAKSEAQALERETRQANELQEALAALHREQAAHGEARRLHAATYESWPRLERGRDERVRSEPDRVSQRDGGTRLNQFQSPNGAQPTEAPPRQNLWQWLVQKVTEPDD